MNVVEGAYWSPDPQPFTMLSVPARCLLITFVISPVFASSTSAPQAPAFINRTARDPRKEAVKSSNVVINLQSSNNVNKSMRKSAMDRDEVVTKFVEVLMNSEKYLRKIDSVDRKISHLESIFYKSFSRIFTELVELANIMKQVPNGGGSNNNALRTLANDVRKLKETASKHKHHHHKGKVDASSDTPPPPPPPPPSGSLIQRVEGADAYHADAALDTRLSGLEGQMKNMMASVDSIATIISEVKNRQSPKTQLRADSPVTALDSMSLITEFRKTLHDQKRKCDCSALVGRSGRVDRTERYPTDCHEIQMQGFNVSGIYKIKPEEMEPFYVLCDLTTAGGGWTVLQNRFDGSQDFYKSWNDYKNGFGNLAGEFWLGLEKLNYLTNQKLYELRVEMEAQTGHEAYAGYSVFTVGPEHEGFRISTLGTYHGTAGDSLSYHAGQKFSTLDADNDEWKDGACAVEHGGAWWYKECDKSNLNGKYSTTPDEHRGQSMYWISFKGPNFPLMKTKMMIRPLPASRPNELADPSRKILESSIVRPTADKPRIHIGDRRVPYDPSHQPQPSFRYDNRQEGFFPSYK